MAAGEELGRTTRLPPPRLPKYPWFIVALVAPKILLHFLKPQITEKAFQPNGVIIDLKHNYYKKFHFKII